MPFAAALPLVVPQETRKEDGSNGAAFAFKPFPVPFSFVRIDKLGTACVLKELLVPPKGPTTGAVIVHIIVIAIGVGVVVVVAVVAAPQVVPNEEVLVIFAVPIFTITFVFIWISVLPLIIFS